jgi:hypothetical protein
MSTTLQDTISKLTQQSSVRLQLAQEMLLEDDTFQTLVDGLQTRKITQLVINLACYEKTLVAKVKPIDLYKFWRKSKPMSVYLA